MSSPFTSSRSNAHRIARALVCREIEHRHPLSSQTVASPRMSGPLEPRSRLRRAGSGPRSCGHSGYTGARCARVGELGVRTPSCLIP